MIMRKNAHSRSYLLNSYKAWAAQHKKKADLDEYLPLEPYQVLCQFYGELGRVGGEVPYLIT